MKIKTNHIYQGDCIKVMKKMDTNSVDLCLTDPPYNAKDIGPNKRTYSEGTMQLPIKEYKKFCRDWFREAKRVSKNILFTPGIANINYYPQPDWIICWHKPAACSFNRMGGYNAWEPVCFYGKMPKGKRLGQDYILHNTLNFTKGIEKEHPCPKPLELMRIFVDKFSLEGQIVLDPFAGSGTTLVAAKMLDRDFIGIEKIKRYVEISQERVNRLQEQLF